MRAKASSRETTEKPGRVSAQQPDDLLRCLDERTAELRAAQQRLQKTNAELLELRAELEERVARRTAELQQARDELELRVHERTRELESANEELEGFSYSVSHDLRAPLRAVSGFAQFLAEEFSSEMPEGARRYVQIICESSLRMERLINDLLTFARFSRQRVCKRPVDMNALARQVVDELRRDQPDRHIEVRIAPLPQVEADPSLIEQVLVNLISNAFKFTRKRDPGVIEVGYSEGAAERIYFVRDNGAGFDPRYADRLFGVFQRLHRADEFEGTGVGLSIVQRLIQRHGGRVWAEGQVDEGACFYFSLPTPANSPTMAKPMTGP